MLNAYNGPRFQEIENKNLSSSLVQSVERRTVNPYVAGSSPAGGATKLSLNLPLKNFSRQPVFLAFLTICVHFTL